MSERSPQDIARDEALRALVQAEPKVLRTPDPLANRRGLDPMASWGDTAMETTTGGGGLATPEMNPIDPQPEGTGGGVVDHPFKIETRVSGENKQYRVLDYLSTVTDGVNGDDMTIGGLAAWENPDSGWTTITESRLIIIEGSVSDSLAVSGLTIRNTSIGDYEEEVELAASGAQTKVRAIIGAAIVDGDAVEPRQSLFAALRVTHAFYNGSLVVVFTHSPTNAFGYA